MFKTAIILAVAFVAVVSASHYDQEWEEESFKGHRQPVGGRFRGRRYPIKRNQFVRRPFRAGGFGAVSANNFDADEGRFGSLNSNNVHDSHNFAEGEKAGLLADRSNFDVENDETHFDDVGAIRKHQVHGSDKTIVKDKSFGVNDVDGFHKSSGSADRNRLNVGQEFLGFGKESGRISNDRFDNSNLNVAGADQKGIHSSNVQGFGASGISA